MAEEAEKQSKDSRGVARVVRKVSLRQQPTDFAYWQTRPYEERLAALEEIRREYHGWRYDTEPRLQRLYQVVKR